MSGANGRWALQLDGLVVSPATSICYTIEPPICCNSHVVRLACIQPRAPHIWHHCLLSLEGPAPRVLARASVHCSCRIVQAGNVVEVAHPLVDHAGLIREPAGLAAIDSILAEIGLVKHNPKGPRGVHG